MFRASFVIDRSAVTDLVPHVQQHTFDAYAFEACMVLSSSKHTRLAYWSDARNWIAFCRENRVNPVDATALVVAAWVEAMKAAKLAPKTRGRRVCALSSVYDWIRRNKKIVSTNPFSVSDGPKREGVITVRPTPIASTEIVAAAQVLCDQDLTFEGMRDAAILRLLWATGIRRSSLVQITFQRLSEDGQDFFCTVPAKGGKTLRLWITGKCARALRRYLKALRAIGVNEGEIFVKTGKNRAMTERDIWRTVRRRGKQAGGELSPHMFRVAFLTLNPASIEEKQDAAGHSSPETTRRYDRSSWRGKKAFTSMPEIEHITKEQNT